MTNHVTVGVYTDDSYKHNIVAPEHLEGHIYYNKVLRPGRAFFVDGKCVNAGYLSDDKIAEWTSKIASMSFNKSEITTPYR